MQIPLACNQHATDRILLWWWCVHVTEYLGMCYRPKSYTRPEIKKNKKVLLHIYVLRDELLCV